MRWGDGIFDPLTTNMSGHIFAQIQAVTYLKWKIPLPYNIYDPVFERYNDRFSPFCRGKEKIKTKVSRSGGALNLFCPILQELTKHFHPIKGGHKHPIVFFVPKQKARTSRDVGTLQSVNL